MHTFDEHLAAHHGVFARTEALRLGVTKSQLATLVRNGRIVRTYPQVFRSAAHKRTRSSLQSVGPAL